MAEWLPSLTVLEQITDWAGVYGALLSTTIALVACVRFLSGKLRAHRERGKLQTSLYFLSKVDQRTRETHPIVVVLVANLGAERIALKSLKYSGVAENGFPVNGSTGWYEQPEEAFGIRRRLLPAVLESGQTVDLPLVEIGVITRQTDLKMWLTDFGGRRYYVPEGDIQQMRVDGEKYLTDAKALTTSPPPMGATG
jgi:hypothetical protein